MNLQQWLENSWIRRTEPSREEVANLLDVAHRDIGDASLQGLSPDGRFAHAYNAVRSLCEVGLHACGYCVPKGGRQHERVIESLRYTLGDEWAERTDFFDRCRRWRHQSMYERIGVVQQRDADDLLGAAKTLEIAVRDWLEQNHPDLI